MALDRKKVKKDLEALDEEDRGLVGEVLKELSGDGRDPLKGVFSPEEILEIKDILKRAKVKGKGGVLGFLRGE